MASKKKKSKYRHTFFFLKPPSYLFLKISNVTAPQTPDAQKCVMVEMGQIYVWTFNTESPFAHITRVLVGGSPEDHMVSPVKETLNQHLLRPRTCDAQHSLVDRHTHSRQHIL